MNHSLPEIDMPTKAKCARLAAKGAREGLAAGARLWRASAPLVALSAHMLSLTLASPAWADPSHALQYWQPGSMDSSYYNAGGM
jgi:hypothetical protein